MSRDLVFAWAATTAVLQLARRLPGWARPAKLVDDMVLSASALLAGWAFSSAMHFALNTYIVRPLFSKPRLEEGAQVGDV
jgi:hypothetical protein